VAFLSSTFVYLDKKSLTRIGLVNKTSGFKGALSCIVSVAHPEKLLKQKFLFVLIDGLPVPFLVEEIEINGDEIFVKFEDVDSEQSAKKLLRKELYSEKIKAQKKSDVITWFELKGYKIVDGEHGELGTIDDVVEYPMQMIARCMVQDREVMFPLNDEIVSDIDEKKKIVYVNLPDGLLDMYLGS
jgi:16S rRNA processing protein RimM